MTTPAIICSNALLQLGAQPITSLEDDSDRARLAKDLFPSVRDDMLRSHPWNCAIKRVALAPLASPPAFGYRYQFQLPGDWLRTLSVSERPHGQDSAEYRSESGTLLADSNVLYLRYIYRNEIPSTWDAMLVQVMERAMAAAMAYAITESTSQVELRANLLEQALKRARAVDGQEDPPDTLGDFRLLSSRFRR